MKISISNIAWKSEYDKEMYSYLKEKNVTGLEIAPTRIFEENPYDHLEEARHFKQNIMDKYGLEISSMQSIWFGMEGNIFNKEEAKSLIDYTKKAVLFAEVLGCNNLVFGCPRNRIKPENSEVSDVNWFFESISSYAKQHNTTISLEANPVIYNTNFINTTAEAFKYIEDSVCENLKINVDLGTIIYNSEDLSCIRENINIINHVHISEPGLACIEKRELHAELKDILLSNGYNKYVSIEMKTQDNVENVKRVIDYVVEVFK